MQVFNHLQRHSLDFSASFTWCENGRLGRSQSSMLLCYGGICRHSFQATLKAAISVFVSWENDAVHQLKENLAHFFTDFNVAIFRQKPLNFVISSDSSGFFSKYRFLIFLKFLFIETLHKCRQNLNFDK